MAEGPEHPKALYRDGGTEEIWGALVETLVVISLDEEMEALSNGWRLHPIRSENDELLTFETAEPLRRRGRPPKVLIDAQA